MAHGSKKWIIDATGKLKKSKNRTKIDYYAAVDYWEEYNIPYVTRKGNKTTVDFCPQCKGIQKEYHEEIEAFKKKDKELHRLYYELYGEAEKEWRFGLWSDEHKPKVPRPPMYWDWKREQLQHDQPVSYHWRNTLCFKHENWEDARRRKWNEPYHGNRAHYRWWVKRCRQIRRADERNAMQKAKYIHDYEGYDDVPVYKRPWLD